MRNRTSNPRRDRSTSASRLRRQRSAIASACCNVPLEELEVRRMLAGWSTVGTNGTPPPNAASMMLLTDGSVMVNPGLTSNWFRLQPNGNDYANGTWSQLNSMSESRLYFSTTMLPSGKVFAIGGEYPKFSNTSEIYDPVANSWALTDAVQTPPDNQQLTGTVTGASNSTPITIATTNLGGLVNGDTVTIATVAGNTGGKRKLGCIKRGRQHVHAERIHRQRELHQRR